MTLPPSGPRPSRRDSLGFNEFVGVFVAFTTIGAILFWSLTRERGLFDLQNLFALTPTEEAPQLLPSPEAEGPVSTPTAPATPEEDRVGRAIVGQRPVGPESVGRETVGAGTAQPVNFSDVADDYWARPFILALSQRGIISGFNDGTFRPNQPVTRAEFATFIQKAFGQSPRQAAVQYNDIPTDFWATQSIQEATQTDFLTGYPGNIFRPTQQIPKVQAVVALASGLGLSTQPAAKPLPYQDASQIPNWATDAVRAATQAGIVVNHPSPQFLNPNKNTTRAEATALIYQALVNARQAEPIVSEFVVQPPRQ